MEITELEFPNYDQTPRSQRKRIVTEYHLEKKSMKTNKALTALLERKHN